MKDLKVIKIGGNVINNPEALDVFLKDFAFFRRAKSIGPWRR